MQLTREDELHLAQLFRQGSRYVAAERGGGLGVSASSLRALLLRLRGGASPLHPVYELTSRKPEGLRRVPNGQLLLAWQELREEGRVHA